MTCCDNAPARIDISATDSTLTFTYCRHCETGRWFRDGSQTTLGDAKQLASDSFSRRPSRVLV